MSRPIPRVQAFHPERLFLCPIAWSLLGIISTVLTGCGAENTDDDESPSLSLSASQGVAQQQTLQGSVHAASSLLAGATLTAYAVNSSQGAPRVVGQGVTRSDGTFTVLVSCAPIAQSPQPIYLIASAEKAPSAADENATNEAIRLVSVIADCASPPRQLTVNELTTVAAAYALNAFITDEAIGGSSPGLPNALATLASLIDPVRGALAESLPAGTACTSAASLAINCDTVEKMNTLADALAACASTSSAGSSTCTTLFRCAAVEAREVAPSTCLAAPPTDLPTDTWGAIIAVARAPGLASSAGLYAVSGSSVIYAPTLAAAPNDWSLALTHTGGGLSEPTALAIDATGNIWVASYNSAVSKFSPSGAVLSPAAGYSGGGLEESFGIAIDARGNVWICNEQSPGSINAGRGSVTELAADGSVISPPTGYAVGGLNFPESLAIDPAGHVWIANYANATLTELDQDGTALSPAAGFSGGGMSFPVGIASDGAGTLWIANQGANQISSFSSAGLALSPAGGYIGGGLDVPQSIAVDQEGDVWTSNYYGNSLSSFSSQGTALSPSDGYVDPSLAAPGGIAIDGAGNVWVANFHGASVTELSGSASKQPGLSRSPSGFSSPEIQEPFAVAVDPSGNLWVSNFGNDTLTEFIGIAAPVVTPLIGAPHSPP